MQVMMVIVIMIKAMITMKIMKMMLTAEMITTMCWIYWRGRLVGDNCFEYKFSQRQ